MIVDPTNPDHALDDDGELTHAIRFTPIPEDGSAPTLAELQNGSIIGYGNLVPFGDDDVEPLPAFDYTMPTLKMWKIEPEQ